MIFLKSVSSAVHLWYCWYHHLAFFSCIVSQEEENPEGISVFHNHIACLWAGYVAAESEPQSQALTQSPCKAPSLRSRIPSILHLPHLRLGRRASRYLPTSASGGNGSAPRFHVWVMLRREEFRKEKKKPQQKMAKKGEKGKKGQKKKGKNKKQ